MWYYERKTGRLTDSAGHLIGEGYAGHGEGLNNPLLSHVPNVGPLPAGAYLLDNPHDSPHTGAFSINLIPDPKNEMFGRSLFRMHGDNNELNHTASDGCIIMPRRVREFVWHSGVRDLIVI